MFLAGQFHPALVPFFINLTSSSGCVECYTEGFKTSSSKVFQNILSIVEIPLSDPASAHVLATPALNVPTWDLLSGIPGFNPLQGCHDIQVDLSRMQAAVACASVGQLWDISDPAKPQTLTPLWQVDQPEVQFYHSALFSEGGDTVIFGDEIIFGSCDDGTGSGQLWFHDSGDGSLVRSVQIPRAQPDQYCSAHLFSNIPGVRGDILVASWYSGGTTVIDYTNRTVPKEVGFYDPENGSVWASCFYNNFIYTNDIVRGVDIFLLSSRYRAAPSVWTS